MNLNRALTACQSLAEINRLYHLSENPAFSGTETESGPFARRSITCFFLIIWIPLVFFSKRIINLAPTTSVPPTLTVPSMNRAQFRVTCGHCNEIFMVGTFWLIKRCFYWFLSSLANTLFFFAQISSFTQQATLPDALTAEECEYTAVAFAVLCMITLFWLEYCFWVLCGQCVYFRSSVGNHFARTRATIFAIIGFIFLAAGVGVTVGTLSLAENSGGKRITVMLSYVQSVMLASYY